MYVFVATKLSHIHINSYCTCLYASLQSYGIFKKNHQGSISKKVCTLQFTTPEVKITFVLFYWVMISVLVFTSHSIKAGRDGMFAYNLRSYAECMAGGNRKHYDCHMLRQNIEAERNPALEVIHFMLIAFLNFASLPFVIQFQTVKRSVTKLQNSCKILRARPNYVSS